MFIIKFPRVVGSGLGRAVVHHEAIGCIGSSPGATPVLFGFDLLSRRHRRASSRNEHKCDVKRAHKPHG
jgi:hypothetical protein